MYRHTDIEAISRSERLLLQTVCIWKTGHNHQRSSVFFASEAGQTSADEVQKHNDVKCQHFCQWRKNRTTSNRWVLR